jgi:hypothetical protein
LIKIYAIMMSAVWAGPARWEFFPAVKAPTAAWIWPGMYGSGVRIGMIVIITNRALKKIRVVLLRARAGCYGAAVGATAPGAAGQPTASASTPPIATPSSVFGLPGLFNFTTFHFTTLPLSTKHRNPDFKKNEKK